MCFLWPIVTTMHIFWKTETKLRIYTYQFYPSPMAFFFNTLETKKSKAIAVWVAHYCHTAKYSQNSIMADLLSMLICLLKNNKDYHRVISHNVKHLQKLKQFSAKLIRSMNLFRSAQHHFSQHWQLAWHFGMIMLFLYFICPWQLSCTLAISSIYTIN